MLPDTRPPRVSVAMIFEISRHMTNTVSPLDRLKARNCEVKLSVSGSYKQSVTCVCLPLWALCVLMTLLCVAHGVEGIFLPFNLTPDPATEFAAPGRLMFKLVRYLRYHDTCIDCAYLVLLEPSPANFVGRQQPVQDAGFLNMSEQWLRRMNRFMDGSSTVLNRASSATHRLKHEATRCSTFSCLETSQMRDSAGFQVCLTKNQISLQMSVSLGTLVI
ncbi:hypothetical protein T265_07973 [Opisthorchis viverrini]|uniref:Uncharacterized protein n=1 Tax=Opisthorchis viverrini TaxID=6198 RepID=A0A074ZB32_OPIVI|nr:hypothetical protein T265_07973 [Opisthorchis viverrini]KER24333.1 hypothetical protein T265_07973 [Opisthorchis viverrini]